MSYSRPDPIYKLQQTRAIGVPQVYERVLDTRCLSSWFVGDWQQLPVCYQCIAVGCLKTLVVRDEG